MQSHPVAHERVPCISSGTRVSLRPEAPRRFSCTAQMRWAGHVYRMDFERLPWKLLTSWVDHPRPRGRPKFHFRDGIARDLTNAGVDIATWHLAAANRTEWLQLTQRPDKLKMPPSSVSQASSLQTLPPPQLPQPTEPLLRLPHRSRHRPPHLRHTDLLPSPLHSH